MSDTPRYRCCGCGEWLQPWELGGADWHVLVDYDPDGYPAQVQCGPVNDLEAERISQLERELAQARADAEEVKKERDAVQAELNDAIPVLEFYANPETWFAVVLFPDPPCGEIMEDFSDTGELGMKPGKRARDLFDKYAAIDAMREEGKK